MERDARLMMTPFAIDRMLMAAGEVAGESKFVLVGSAAVIAWRPDVPVTMAMSVEIDIFGLSRDPDEVEVILESNLGQGSSFHATHGRYIDAVSPNTARLPDGWRDRALTLTTTNRKVTALVPEPNDIAVSKLVRCLPRDLDFIVTGIAHGVFNLDAIVDRGLSLDISDLGQGAMAEKIEILLGRLIR